MVSGITWSLRPREIGARLNRQVDTTASELHNLVRGVVDDGADDMRRFILEATTKTGNDRVASGGTHAGRYETGTMYDAVDSNVVIAGIGDRAIFVGSFGWLNDVLNYYLIQENGSSKIDAMHALHKAFINASEKFQKQVNDIVRKNF